MSLDFYINFVNNTPFNVTLTATVKDPNDWGSDLTLRPDKITGAVAPFSASAPFQERLQAERSTAPFTVVATFDGHDPIAVFLDGCNAIDSVNDGEMKVIKGSSVFSVFQITYPASESPQGLNQMTIFLTHFVSPRNWMGRLIEKKDSLTLADITLPGTHDTGTYGGTHEEGTQCQSMDIRMQLEAGIRFMDLRFKKYDDYKDLGIFHQNYTQNLWFRMGVLPVIAQFLAENPTECVIVCVNHAVDVSNEPWDERSYDSLLHDILTEGLPTNELYDKNDTTAFPLKLSSLQGCLVLMRRDIENKFGLDVLDWPDNPAYYKTYRITGTSIELQDAYSTGLGDISSKWKLVEDHFDRAQKQSSGWFINFTSASSRTAPAAPWFPEGYATGKDTTQWGINSLLSRYLASDLGQSRLGTIVMDFPEYPGNNLLSRLLIARNERLF